MREKFIEAFRPATRVAQQCDNAFQEWSVAMAKNKSHKSELGPDSAGQSGDLQQISNKADADSESVQELIEEGNAFEAAAVAGVENAEDADVSEVHTHQVPEDDVPAEYLDDDGHI
jgi:hypothetical protein